MKRVGYLWEKIIAIENIELAIHRAAKNKRKTRAVKRALDDVRGTALAVQEALIAGKYKPCKPTKKRINERGKEREIQIPRFFLDQIVHWAVMLQVTPVLERGMYKYCCGSVKHRGGKGVQREVKRIMRNKRLKYILKGDVRKFFGSVDIRVMEKLLRRVIKDKKVLEILDAILESTAGNLKRGLPIGYYTSQILSNFYLLTLDHYIKEKLRIKKYIRYVDDIVLSDTNKRKLHKARVAINNFLHKSLHLQLKDNWQVWRAGTRPLDFVGYRYYTCKTLLRKRTFYAIMRTVARIKRAAYVTIKQAQGLLSRLGWLKHIPERELYLDQIKPTVSKKQLKQAAKGDGIRANLHFKTAPAAAQ